MCSCLAVRLARVYGLSLQSMGCTVRPNVWLTAPRKLQLPLVALCKCYAFTFIVFVIMINYQLRVCVSGEVGAQIPAGDVGEHSIREADPAADRASVVFRVSRHHSPRRPRRTHGVHLLAGVRGWLGPGDGQPQSTGARRADAGNQLEDRQTVVLACCLRRTPVERIPAAGRLRKLSEISKMVKKGVKVRFI